ncbi:MAG: hypothetical protein EHM61_26055 [Acidobacteria bacterium]|nr:MAG: hypothetical protein EHM61_26055 [Acidobacteriota bacterium]
MWRNFVAFVFLSFALAGGALWAQESKSDRSTRSGNADQDVQTIKPGSKTRLRFGGFSVGAYRTSYPLWYPYYYPYSYSAYYGWSPYFWPAYPSPLYPAAYWPTFSASEGRGKVKFENGPENAELSIDGAYAGVLKDLKTIWLDPGAYNVELRVPDKKPYLKRIYVLTGKTVTLTPAFQPETEVQP